ncbi:H17B6-like protein [Mya arenaria]|uniref:H17B6-like protein n=1 Tax=Mya arenaria TaxID=6604 RepID=A0ABY7EIH9_MYAAR|nr:H17B6-like protein [Mya arenaria]
MTVTYALSLRKQDVFLPANANVTYYIFDWIIRRGNVENIAKKSVFITGCDTGFVNLLGKTLDQKGVLVYAGCLTNNGVAQLNKDSSSRLKTLIINVLDNESITYAFRTIEEDVKDGGLWGVVNNAGVGSGFIPFQCNPLAVLERTTLVNLVGPMAVAHTFLPLLRKSGGRLVNVCRNASIVPVPGLADFCSSKAGLKMFTSCLSSIVQSRCIYFSHYELYQLLYTCKGIHSYTLLNQKLLHLTQFLKIQNIILAGGPIYLNKC